MITDSNSDQVVVTTLADLFDIKKARSKGHSAQLVGLITEEALRHLTEKRYNSRFRVSAIESGAAESDSTSSLSVVETQTSGHVFPPLKAHNEKSYGPKTRHERPSSNEMRKRGMRGATD